MDGIKFLIFLRSNIQTSYEFIYIDRPTSRARPTRSLTSKTFRFYLCKTWNSKSRHTFDVRFGRDLLTRSVEIFIIQEAEHAFFMQNRMPGRGLGKLDLLEIFGYKRDINEK